MDDSENMHYYRCKNEHCNMIARAEGPISLEPTTGIKCFGCCVPVAKTWEEIDLAKYMELTEIEDYKDPAMTAFTYYKCIKCSYLAKAEKPNDKLDPYSFCRCGVTMSDHWQIITPMYFNELLWTKVQSYQREHNTWVASELALNKLNK